MLGLCLADSRNLYLWYVLESIHKCIIELHVLQCLFVRGSNKNKREAELFQITQRGKPFHLLWQRSALGSNRTMWPLFLARFKKGLVLPFSLAKKIIYLDTQLKAELTSLFWDRMFPLLTSRNRIMHTFIIFNITSTYKG